MTSISHAASSAASFPSLGLGRFRFGADSKAVRTGLGVAIAAVMAGDVYAVLRSPVSERTSMSSSSSGAAAVTGSAGAAGSGFVATNPFSEAAHGADLAGRMIVPVVSTASARRSVASIPGGGAAAAMPAVSAPVLTPAPAAAAPVVAVEPPTILPPVAPPVVGPSGPSGDANDPAPAEPSLVQQVVSTVGDAPAVGGPVEQVVEAAPVPVSSIESEAAPLADVVEAPVGSAPGSGLSL